jgi:hypothetical protein
VLTKIFWRFVENSFWFYAFACKFKLIILKLFIINCQYSKISHSQIIFTVSYFAWWMSSEIRFWQIFNFFQHFLLKCSVFTILQVSLTGSYRNHVQVYLFEFVVISKSHVIEALVSNKIILVVCVKDVHFQMYLLGENVSKRLTWHEWALYLFNINLVAINSHFFVCEVITCCVSLYHTVMTFWFAKLHGQRGSSVHVPITWEFDVIDFVHHTDVFTISWLEKLRKLIFTHEFSDAFTCFSGANRLLQRRIADGLTFFCGADWLFQRCNTVSGCSNCC